MKNLILTMCLLLTVSLTFAQLHVTKNSDPDLNGAVGIGTSSPTKMLDVNGSATIRGGRLIVGSEIESEPANEQEGPAELAIGFNRKKSGRAFFKLHPLGQNTDGSAGKSISTFMATPEEQTVFTHSGTGYLQLTAKKSYIDFVTNQGGRMVIREKGNVGIGTTTPGYKLHVNGTAAKEGNDGWEVLSDKRTKKNIDTYSLGLSEVLKLNPVTFKYNGKAGIEDTEKKYVGLIAQEFAEIMPDAVSKYTHTDTVTNKTEEYMAINASSVRYMLVNGMKEQQALIEAQKAELETLKETVAKLVTNGASISTPGTNEMSVLLEGNGTESALLAQNTPNPFTTNTRIEYFIPQNSKDSRLSFRDMNGKELKQVNIEHDGIGAIELSAKDLAVGIYSYVLYVNGDIIASKKMILRQ